MGLGRRHAKIGPLSPNEEMDQGERPNHRRIKRTRVRPPHWPSHEVAHVHTLFAGGRGFSTTPSYPPAPPQVGLLAHPDPFLPSCRGGPTSRASRGLGASYPQFLPSSKRAKCGRQLVTCNLTTSKGRCLFPATCGSLRISFVRTI